MHLPVPADDDGPDGLPEPQVLSYVQFRNQLTLLEWRRRRAAYERGGMQAAAAAMRRGSGRDFAPRS